MQGNKRSSRTESNNYQAGTNVDLVFLKGKDPKRSHFLPGVHFSFSADPTGAYVLIEVLDPEETSTYRTVGKHYVAKAGPGPLEFVCPYETPFNTGLRITLKAGGSGIASTFELCGYSLQGSF